VLGVGRVVKVSRPCREHKDRRTRLQPKTNEKILRQAYSQSAVSLIGGEDSGGACRGKSYREVKRLIFSQG